MQQMQSERGSALVGTLFLVLILTIMGGLSVNLAAQELESVRAAQEDAMARHLAEAGGQAVIQWFHRPGTGPDGSLGALFAKSQSTSDGGASFFSSSGESQFVGTADRPDVWLDAGRPSDERILNDPNTGWFRSLRGLGRILTLKVYGPVRPGLLCTVEVTAGVGKVVRTVAFSLGARSIPPLHSAVEVGNGGGPLQPFPLPVQAHWGGVKIQGDVRLGTVQQIPAKTGFAEVSGRSYTDMTHHEDRWIEYWIGGEAIWTPTVLSVGNISLAHVHTHQDPTPGLRLDPWEYAQLKEAARTFGTYYARGGNGLLYRDGVIEPGQAVTVDDVFRSEAVGQHHGLVFIDTLDGQAPNGANLGTLTVTTDYAEGLFVVNANLVLAPQGTGRSVAVLSPPAEGSTQLATRVPVQLGPINIQGVLYVAGNLAVEGHPSIYGGLIVGGTVTPRFGGNDALEVWYNADLQKGLVRGVPLVYVASGTWAERY
jgi:hypothetical protein